MAKKTNRTVKKPQGKPASDDAAVWKVLGALVLMIVSLIVLNKTASLYDTSGGFDIVHPGSRLCVIICAVLLAASVILPLLWRRPVVRTVCLYVFALSLLWGLTGLVLRLYWTDEMVFLYFLHSLFYCSYMIYQLYQTEFFLVTLVAGFSGGLFYRFSRGISASFPGIFLCAALALSVVCACVLGHLAGKNSGLLSLGSRKLRVFPAIFNPLMLYIACAICLVCLIAGLLLGSLFFYYCMFAVIALELVAAVYYTFQLR